MLRKSFVFILLSVSTCAFVFAQDTAPGRAGSAVSGFSMLFDGDGSYLGIQSVEVTKENFSKYGLRDVRGVAVEKVIDGSPAQTAGLQNGDVIVKFNGEDVTSTRKLSRLISEVAPDHQTKISILRSGDDREITATVGKRPAARFGNGSFATTIPSQLGRIQIPPMAEMAPMPPMAESPLFRQFPGESGVRVFSSGTSRRIGINVTPLSKQLSEHFDVAQGAVMIDDVRENSAAAKAGLKAGDIIVEIDGKEIKGNGDLTRTINQKKEGDVQLTIVRDKARQTISVTPEEVKGDFNNFFEMPEGSLTPPARMKTAKPATPATPVPLNQIYLPGRIL